MGARVVEGGTHDGLFYRPTVVVDVTPDMPVWNEEIFGPVAPVLAVDDDAEALALVNDTPVRARQRRLHAARPRAGCASPRASRRGWCT